MGENTIGLLVMSDFMNVIHVSHRGPLVAAVRALLIETE